MNDKIISIVIGVAPFAGAWIEIFGVVKTGETGGVAPFAGAWIEIPIAITQFSTALSRSLCGSVD